MKDLNTILTLAAIMGLTGVFGLLLRKNLILMLMSLELMILSSVLAFVGAASIHTPILAEIASGGLMVPMILVVAACEAAVGLSLVLKIYKDQKTIWVDEIDKEKK